MSNEAKHTPLIERSRFLAAGQDDPHSMTITELCDAYEATRRLLVECESFLTRINQLASPNPERTFDNAITDLGYVADYARATLAAISEHRKANQ